MRWCNKRIYTVYQTALKYSKRVNGTKGLLFHGGVGDLRSVQEVMVFENHTHPKVYFHQCLLIKDLPEHN